MRFTFIIFSLLLSLCETVFAQDLVIVVNPESGVQKLTKEEAVNIFMGRYRKLSSGVTALPVDTLNPPSVKARFYSLLVGKELSEINSYWARLLFSGQASPPRQADNVDEVIDIVGNNKGAIGYMDKSKVDSHVRVVLELSQ